MKEITVVVVDDHRLIREMYTQLFFNNENIEVIGESGTLDEAIEMIKIKRPDIVLLDINLGNDSGMDAVPLIRKFSPGSRIIAVSVDNQPAYAKKMLKLGAKGYITKNSSRLEIITAIQQVMNGGSYLCNDIKDALATQMLCNDAGESHLTNREREIIDLVKKGYTSKEIALNAHITSKTVEVHRYNILKKLGLKNTVSLINFINTSGLTFHR